MVGKHCESGDIVIKDVALSANLGPGDVLAVPTTGAYGRSMASNYNMLTKPAFAVRNGEARWLLRPETARSAGPRRRRVTRLVVLRLAFPGVRAERIAA